MRGDSGTTVLIPSSAGGELAVHLHRAGADGGSSGPVAVLVHGFGSDANANWVRSGWVRALVAAGITAVAPDLPGHGASARPHRPESYSLAGLVADVSAVVDGVSHWCGPSNTVDVVGYSLGARTVAELAAARVSGPAIRRLVLGGYGGGPLLHGVDAVSLGAALRRGGSMTGSPSSGTGLDEPTARIARIARMLPGGDPRALTALVQGLIAEGRVSRATPLPAQPTLVVAGSLDPVAASAARWVGTSPHSRHLTIAGRNHLDAVTSGAFRSAALEFLTRPDAASAAT